MILFEYLKYFYDSGLKTTLDTLDTLIPILVKLILQFNATGLWKIIDRRRKFGSSGIILILKSVKILIFKGTRSIIIYAQYEILF